MRLKVVLRAENAACVPLNHHDLLTGLVYRLLGQSSEDYSTFLHDTGFVLEGSEGPRKTFKLFTFSGLRSKSRQVQGEWLILGPGAVEWLLASPVAAFLQHCATGLLNVGELRVGRASLPIQKIESVPLPDFSTGQMNCICLTPIVAAVTRPIEEGRHPLYLRPADGERFSRAVHENLARKHQVLFGSSPEGPPVRIQFNPEYLRRRHGGTKLVRYKGIDYVGALAPFQATGDPRLLQIGYECGFGQKNAGGFGMVEVQKKDGTNHA